MVLDLKGGKFKMACKGKGGKKGGKKGKGDCKGK